MQHRHRIESLVGPLGFWNKLQAYQLHALTMQGLKPHHTVLDIGCGPLQGGIAFIRYLEPSHYVGVDLKVAALEAAHQEITRHKLSHKGPRLLFSRSFGDEQLGDAEFDFIWLSQVLYYFDEPALHSLFSLASRRLRPHGILTGDIFGPGSDYSFLRHPRPPLHTEQSLCALAKLHGLRLTRLGTLVEFGYPKRLNLRHNILLRATRESAK